MTKDTLRFTSQETISHWLEMSDVFLSIYSERQNDSMAKELREEVKLVRFMQKSCRLLSVTFRDGEPLYHYELSGPTLTQLRILDPDFVTHLKRTTEYYLT